VSLDERTVVVLIASATRRARALFAAELVAWAAAAAAVAFALTTVSGAAGGTRIATIAAVEFATALAVGLGRRGSIARSAVIRAIERAHPASRNLILTTAELAAGELPAPRLIHARVLADAAAAARSVDIARAFPPTRTRRVLAAAAAAWLVAVVSTVWRHETVTVVQRLISASLTSSSSPRVVATIQPPSYTGLPIRTLIDPAQIDAVEGSTATVVMGSDTTRATLQKTGYITIGEGDRRRTIPVVVSPDALPSVRLTAPGRDLVYAGGNARIAFDARATDDFGLRSLALQYTKVSGSGENFTFKDGTIPLDVAKASAREWIGRVSRSLAELDLKDGDVLVYRAVAADGRPGDGTASSDAFLIEVSKLGVAAGDAFTLPDEETRYALSQQMLIVKTERLQQRRGALAPAAVTEEALNLAVEQRMIRAEIVFMLGGEVENEEVEAEQSNELQEGRLQNRGQRDLRAATVAMSQAEKLLTATNTAEALVAERAAVAALQRAFARNRYILRALATRSQLDVTRRLTGNLSEARDWRRAPASAPPNRRAALLQDVLRGISDLRSGTPTHARVLAEEAIRIDPASAELRRAATELQRAADADSDATAFARAIAAAASAVIAEARRSQAGAPVDASAPAPDLTGAYVDALNARLKGSRSFEGRR